MKLFKLPVLVFRSGPADSFRYAEPPTGVVKLLRKFSSQERTLYRVYGLLMAKKPVPKAMTDEVGIVRLSDFKRLNDCWGTLFNIYTCLDPSLLTGMTPSCDNDFQALACCRYMIRWMLKTWVARGIYFVKKCLKSLFEDLRASSLDPLHWEDSLLKSGCPCRASVFGPFLDRFSGENLQKVLFFLSTGKRALCAPNEAELDEALLKFHKTCSELRSNLPPKVLDIAENYAAGYPAAIGRRLEGQRDPLLRAMHVPVSSSATRDSTVEDGGFFNDISGLESLLWDKRVSLPEGRTRPKRPLYTIFGTPIYLSTKAVKDPTVGNIFPKLLNQKFVSEYRDDDDDEDEDLWGSNGIITDALSPVGLLIGAIFFALTCGDLGFKDDQLLSDVFPDDFLELYEKPPEVSFNFRLTDFGRTAVADAVDDAGGKSRVITLSSSPILIVQHCCRTMLIKIFEQDKNCVLNLKHDKIGKLTRFLQGSEDPTLSLDLSCATDTFSREVCRSLYNGLAKGSKIIDPYASGILEACGPICVPDWIIRCRKKGLFPEFDSKTGIMMGTPISWLILNLYNKFFRNFASVLYKTDKTLEEFVEMKEAFVDATLLPFTMFCGDDCVTSDKEPVLRRFLDLLIRSGASPSPGVNSVSRHYMTFTELFFIRNDETRNVKLVSVPKLKCFAPKQFASRLPREKEIPAEWTRGSASASQIEFSCSDDFFKEWLPTLRRLPFYHNHDFVRTARKLGLPIYLGPEFGGLGYYHRPGRSDPPRILNAVGHLTRRDGNLENFLSLKSLGSTWNVDAESELGATSRNFAEYAIRRSGAISLQKFCDMEDEKIPDYLKFDGEDGLWALVDKARKAGYIPLKEFSDAVEGFVYSSFPTEFKRVSYGETPSIFEVAKKFNRILSSILEETKGHKYDIASLKKLNWWDIQARLKWRGYTFFIPEEELNVVRCHAFDKNVKNIGAGFFYLGSDSFDRFYKSAKIKLDY